MEIREPQNKEEWDKYYHLRWKVLRQPWNQPLGTERDTLEDQAKHFAAFEEANIIGVGRLDHVDFGVCQIRFMAVQPTYQSYYNYNDDETLIREQSNIYHYDIFEGIKKIAWPNFTTYNSYYPTGISYWSEEYTNVDYIHQYLVDPYTNYYY